mgnify:CR=1 FL=1
MSDVSNRINLDAIINDIEVEINESNLSYFPLTIEKGSTYVRLRNFKYDMISTCFIRFLERFCSERDVNWFVSLDTQSVIIG